MTKSEKARKDAQRDMRKAFEEELAESRLRATRTLRIKLYELSEALDQTEELGWVSREDAQKQVEKQVAKAREESQAALKDQMRQTVALAEALDAARRIPTEYELQLARLKDQNAKLKEEIASLKKGLGERRKQADQESLETISEIQMEPLDAVYRFQCRLCAYGRLATHSVRLPAEVMYLCADHAQNEQHKYKYRSRVTGAA